MRMLLDQGLLIIAAAALGSAGFRLAARAAPGGLERLVAAAVYAVAAAVAQALLLGRLGLGGSGWALCAAAVVTWLLARRFLPASEPSAADQWRRWALSTPARERAVPLGFAGAVAGAVAWGQYRPTLGLDGFTYHLAEAVTWVQRGTTGSVEPLIVALPVGNYPVTNEVAVAWALGLSHGFAPVEPWSGLLVLVFVASAWLGLRRLGAPGWISGLAIAAFALTPLVARQAAQSETDFPALAWLAATAALSAAAVRHPRLLAPAVVAAGLAVGTKTTTLPLATFALIGAGIALRGRLAPLARSLLVAAAAALVVGGTWYVRNLLDHGSPLWPLVSTPWGDPVPSQLTQLDHRFIERPRATLQAVGISFYRDALAGILLVLVAGALSPLWARRRELLPWAAATVIALLLWAAAPYTGASGIPLFDYVPLNTARYLSPALAAGTLVLALAARTGRRAALVAGAVLAAALIWNLARYAAQPYLPADAVLVIVTIFAAAGGAALGLRPPPLRAAAAALALIAFVGLALSAEGWLERHARSGEFDSKIVSRFLAQPAWREGSAPIAQTPTVRATLAGDRLEHPIDLVGARESCRSIRRRVRRGWVVVDPAEPELFPPLAVERCLRGVAPQGEGLPLIYGTGGP